jgi:hypothetical protein
MKKGNTDETKSIYRGANHQHPPASRSRSQGCRPLPTARHGRGDFYKWKAKYGGLQVSDAQKLKRLEEENAKLKRVVADLTLDNVALKDLLTKKW